MGRTRRWTAASAEEVWDVLADGWSYSTWVVGTSRIRYVDPDWPAVGAELHHSVGVWPAVIDDVTTVLRSEPGRRLVLWARGGPVGEASVDLTLRPDRAGGCCIVMREDTRRGPGRLLPAPLRAAALLPRNFVSLSRLIDLAERPARSRRSPW